MSKMSFLHILKLQVKGKGKVSPIFDTIVRFWSWSRSRMRSAHMTGRSRAGGMLSLAYFQPGPEVPSQSQSLSITTLWPVPYYTAWGKKTHEYEQLRLRVVTQPRPYRQSNRDHY